MAIAAAFVVAPLGLLFILSGLIVNFIQCILYVTLYWCSKNTYRVANKAVVELLWFQLVWLIDWWAHVEAWISLACKEALDVTKTAVFYNKHSPESGVTLVADPTFGAYLQEFFPGKEHALVICNHRSDIDWLVGWVIAQRSGCLGSTLAVMKKSSKFLPVIGWSMWFSDYLFLERSWAKDESTLKSGLQRLKYFPRPLWLALFVEGTRFTPAKLLAAKEYAASARFPIPRNVLVPRTKGFVAAVSHMRSFVPAIYDVTVAVPKSQPSPTMLRILKGQSSVVHVHVKRHAMTSLPQADDGVAQWCRDVFVAKDALLDKHLAEDTFGKKDFKNIGRPKKPLLVVISWSCLLAFGAFKFFKWSTLLSTRRGLAFSAACLVLVIIVMQIFIVFSQSESSTAAKAAITRSKSKGILNPNAEKQQ